MAIPGTTANERTRRRLMYAVRRREALVKLLAPDLRCAECLDVFRVERLVVDHADYITWDRSRMSPQMRAARYWREYHAGVPLRALCGSCSGVDGQKRRGRRRW